MSAALPSGAADYSGAYDPDADFDRVYTLATAERIVERIRPGQSVLELGCATGLMSAAIVAAGATLTGVDRSAPYLALARARRLAGARFVQADVRGPLSVRPAEHVVATNLLHELEDPGAALAVWREWLAPGGVLWVSVPNPRSIHRLVALEMGLIRHLSEVSERGRAFATLDMIEAEELERLGRRAGLALVRREGVMLKPLPNREMAALPPEVLRGFALAARHLPEHCAITLTSFCRA